MKIIATIEARMTSTRLPGKVLADIGGRPALGVMVERLRLVPQLARIVVATTKNRTDDPVADLARRLDVGVWRGSEHDVLRRVLDAATHHGADIIVELTGDCPLIDPAVVSKVIEVYGEAGVDYASNILTRTYPIGMDTQVFATSVLADVATRTDDAVDHEHVSLFIYRHPEIYSLANVPALPSETRPELRLTLDTPQDLEVLRAVFAALHGQGKDFSVGDIIAFIDANPAIAAINASIQHRHA